MDRFRKAVEKQYKGLCDVYEYQSVKDPVTHITSKGPVKVLENVKCKLSFESLTATTEKDGAPKSEISTKLFLSPDIEIKDGSKIVVTQDGITGEYSQSGEPGHFSNHQEIVLKKFKGWS